MPELTIFYLKKYFREAFCCFILESVLKQDYTIGACFGGSFGFNHPDCGNLRLLSTVYNPLAFVLHYPFLVSLREHCVLAADNERRMLAPCSAIGRLLRPADRGTTPRPGPAAARGTAGICELRTRSRWRSLIRCHQQHTAVLGNVLPDRIRLLQPLLLLMRVRASARPRGSLTRDLWRVPPGGGGGRRHSSSDR